MSEHLNNQYILGADIGGSHISSALVAVDKLCVLEGSLFKGPVDAKGSVEEVLQSWTDTLKKSLDSINWDTLNGSLIGIAIAMPGPFDYANGISLITGVNKYEEIFGINIAEAIKQAILPIYSSLVSEGTKVTLLHKQTSSPSLITEQSMQLHFNIPIVFENDACCYGLGESSQAQAKGYNKLLALTLGTGFGASFIAHNRVLKEGVGVPFNGELYSMPFKDGIAEDYISSKWLTQAYQKISNNTLTPRYIAKKALEQKDSMALQVFEEFGMHIGECLISVISQFEPDAIVIGGSITRSDSLFFPAIRETLLKAGVGQRLTLYSSSQTEKSAIIGAAANLKRKINNMEEMTPAENEVNEKNEKFIKFEKNVANGNHTTAITNWRLSSQKLLPIHLQENKLVQKDNLHENGSSQFELQNKVIKSENQPSRQYDCYPYTAIGKNLIHRGYAALANWMATQKCIMIDGFIGNDWSYIREVLSDTLIQKGVKVLWYEMSAFQKDGAQIDQLVKPFLGERGAVWGTKTSLVLSDFYRSDKLEQLNIINNAHADSAFELTVIIGVGASLAHLDGPVIYFDLPKNELQYRMRAGSALNLGESTVCGLSSADYADRYKRSYFVDWVVLAKHRQNIKDKIEIIVDGQWKQDITWSYIQAINQGLSIMTKDAFRVRPWFEAGSWGGQWLKNNISELPQDEINYAWSFELITPENGIIFESDQLLLEISFDWLMEFDAKAVLGKRDAARFGLEFPIRFDFLDTFDGANLSIQCHPSIPYIQQNFGEKITQDETYYILDCKPDAVVYLGFQKDIQPDKFREVLERSVEQNIPIEVEDFIQVHPSHKHDLFLIPNGTVHSSGKNNLVLEISATPYIFTFKMYDWLSLDLNGNPRPINIDHAFQNLNFSRKGDQVAEQLISKPFVMEEGSGFQIISLPTHPEHFYAISRLEFDQKIQQSTNDRAHVLMLVEGDSILIQTKSGQQPHRFHYGETIVIPADATDYQIINEKPSIRAKVVQAFVK